MTKETMPTVGASSLSDGLYESYIIETLAMVRALGSRINECSDEKIIALYREWSGIFFCAGWITPSEKGINSFIIWSTTAPCDISDNTT